MADKSADLSGRPSQGALVARKELVESGRLNTYAGLKGLKRPDEVARMRGKSPEEVTPAGVLRAYQESERVAKAPPAGAAAPEGG